MEKICLGKSGLSVPRIAVGCMRVTERGEDNTRRLIESALERGYNFFDHADIYGGGECEALFSKAYGMTPARREKLILQSKCGIVPGKRFDFSKEHIISSVEGSLKRLNTEYLDVLLLHRPDALVEPEEVAEAFNYLESRGMVRHFGVSNQNPLQIELLQRSLSQPLAANQLQLSIVHSGMIKRGINVNMISDGSVDHDGGVLDYCRLNNITIQPWSPFQFGFFGGVFIGNDKFPELNAALDEIAEKYGVTPTTVALAWILRHPAKMMPVTGTTDIARLNQCFDAADITLTRDEWYRLYMAAGNILP